MKRAICIIAGTLLMLSSFTSSANVGMDIWFSPGWKVKPQQAKEIANALSKDSGVTVKPRIANSYTEILKSFDSKKPNLVYVGSFVQAIIHARKLGKGMVQAVNGKEHYAGVLVYKKGEDPKSIIKNNGKDIAYAVGASSGESCAKAATGGKAAFKVKNHKAAVGAVKAGRAKAAVVKNWWWEANKAKYPDMAVYEIPGISLVKNPDNVLTASNGVPNDIVQKLKTAAMKSKHVFKADSMKEFSPADLKFTLELMKKGHIDPMRYSW